MSQLILRSVKKQPSANANLVEQKLVLSQKTEDRVYVFAGVVIFHYP